MKDHHNKEKPSRKNDEKTVSQRTVPSTVQAMHAHYGEITMTEALQQNAESRQTAHIFDIAQNNPKKIRKNTSSSIVAMLIWIFLVHLYAHVDTHTHRHTYTWCLHNNNTLDSSDLPDPTKPKRGKIRNWRQTQRQVLTYIELK